MMRTLLNLSVDPLDSLIIWGLALVLMSSAGAVITVESGAYIFTAEMSAEEGCGQAVERIKLENIAEQCGAHLSGGKLRALGDGYDLLDQLYFESTAGHLTQFKIKKKEVILISTGSEAPLFRCSVEAALEVSCNQGERNPYFAPLFTEQISLNQLSFREGDEMKIFIDVPQPMSITVLQLLPYLESGEQVWRIFPNLYQPEGWVEKAEQLSIPNQEGEYQLIAKLPIGKNRVVEELVVIAIDEKGDKDEKIKFPDQMSVEQFHQLLAEIPLNQRREKFIPYEIIKERSVQ